MKSENDFDSTFRSPLAIWLLLSWSTDSAVMRTAKGSEETPSGTLLSLIMHARIFHAKKRLIAIGNVERVDSVEI
jgi:hypothetical protein